MAFSRRTVRTALVALMLGAGGGTWLALLQSDTRDPNLLAEDAGVRVSRVASRATPQVASWATAALRGERSARAEAAPGDLLVENGLLSFVIGGDVASGDRQGRRGVLLDLVVNRAHDELVDLLPMVRVAAQSVTLDVGEIRLVTDGEFPFLRVVQTSRDGRFRLDTDYVAPPGSSAISITTRLHAGGAADLEDLELGERTRWPGARTFAPGVGFPTLSSRAKVRWIARQGKGLSYALAFPEGPVEARFLFDRVDQIGQETLARLGDLEAGQSVEYRRELITVEGGLGRAAELAEIAVGRSLGWVEGWLEVPPTWAVVEARRPDGRPELVVPVDDAGRFRMALPTGRYDIVLRSPGGEDAQGTLVEAGKTRQLRLRARPAARLAYGVTDADGDPMPARLMVRGVPPTQDPPPHPLELERGARHLFYSRSGRGLLELPAGRYRVTATHGPEYELATSEVELRAGEETAWNGPLVRAFDSEGWVACDFHLHAAPSRDSSVSLEDRVVSLLAEGVDCAVATDHNHVTDYSSTLRALDLGTELATGAGVEITTATWGHFNAFPYPLNATPPPYRGVTPLAIFAAVRASAPGAVIQVNHPRMPGVGYFNRIELDAQSGSTALDEQPMDFDAIEVMNGYDLENPQQVERNLREYFALLDLGRRYTATGNSDSHRLLMRWAGYPRTYVRLGVDTPELITLPAVARSLAAGHAQVSNGIFLSVSANDQAGPGDTLTGPELELRVTARAPGWADLKRLEIWINGEVALSKQRGAEAAGELDYEVELALARDSWIVVVARGERPMAELFPKLRVVPFAFTNPLFVDADEDGVFTAPRSPRED